MEFAASLNRADTADGRVVGKPFAKGRSGNPAGRPRKPKAVAEVRKILRGSIHEMVRAAAFAPVQVEIDGELAEITALEAGMREVAMQAARGDRLALLALTRLLASTAGEVEEEPVPAEPAAEVVAPEIETAEAYKQGWSIVAECNRIWQDTLPLPEPRPDTIDIDRIKGEVRFSGGPPAEPLSLDGLIALYRDLHGGLCARVEELRMPKDRRPKATREWIAVARLIEQLEPWLPAQHHLPPPLPPIDQPDMEFEDVLEAGYQRSLLFYDGFPEANAASAPTDREPAPGGTAEPEPAPAPAEADEPPAPESEETATCRDICTRALAAAGGTSFPPPEDGATVTGLQDWLATLNQQWDRLEYDWACTRLQTVRDTLERRQQRVARARAVVEQGLAAWDREHPPEADAAEAPDETTPSWERAEAEAYVRIWRQAMEGTEGSFFDLRTPKPPPHLVGFALSGVECHGELGPGDGPTIANLRRWPARLAAIEAELAADIRAERDPGVLVQLRSRRWMAERAREVVEEALTEWDAAASLAGAQERDSGGGRDQCEPGGGPPAAPEQREAERGHA